MSLTSSNLPQLLERAALRRAAPFGKLRAFRLFDGAGDGFPGLFIDRFGEVAVVHLHCSERESESLISRLRDLAPTLAESGKVSSAVAWLHLPKGAAASKDSCEVLFGLPADQLTTCEHGAKYHLRPTQQRNAGLFLDMREMRRWLISNSANRRVLNTFCFTGSLGVASLMGGASEVTQVDNSKAILSWAKENIDLNLAAIDGKATSKLICEDARKFMQREVRRIKEGKREPYQIVIIDPPSFGAAGKKFSLKQELGTLIELAFELTNKGAGPADIIASCNLRSVAAKDIESALLEHAQDLSRVVKEVSPVLPPQEDFTSSASESIAVRGARITLKN